MSWAVAPDMSARPGSEVLQDAHSHSPLMGERLSHLTPNEQGGFQRAIAGLDSYQAQHGTLPGSHMLTSLGTQLSVVFPRACLWAQILQQSYLSKEKELPERRDGRRVPPYHDAPSRTTDGLHPILHLLKRKHQKDSRRDTTSGLQIHAVCRGESESETVVLTSLAFPSHASVKKQMSGHSSQTSSSRLEGFQPLSHFIFFCLLRYGSHQHG